MKINRDPLSKKIHFTTMVIVVVCVVALIFGLAALVYLVNTYYGIK